MKIRIKSGDCPSYLTVGKVYEVCEIFDGDKSAGWIITDNGRQAFIKVKHSSHLNGGSWEIVND